MVAENEETPQQTVCYRGGDAKPAAVEGLDKKASEEKGWR